jgi:CO/xanthine dehydrogenase Mo-binding subunit
MVYGPGGQRAKYVDLLAAAAALPVPAAVTLKTPDKFKLLGTRQARLDVKPKTNGTAIYGLDVKIPGMKYASIEKPVQIGGKVASFDATAALKYPGVRKVIQVPSGVAVIADNTWAAFQGRGRPVRMPASAPTRSTPKRACSPRRPASSSRRPAMWRVRCPARWSPPATRRHTSPTRRWNR